MPVTSGIVSIAKTTRSVSPQASPRTGLSAGLAMIQVLYVVFAQAAWPLRERVVVEGTSGKGPDPEPI
jgi:hypothetical protein